MAKYYAAPWGIIIGKLGEAVGKYYMGRAVVFAYSKNRNMKTKIEFLKQIRTGNLEKNQINEKTVNVRFVFKLLLEIAKLTKLSLINPIWNEKAKNDKRIPFNLFIGTNMNNLLHSIPNPKILCDTNNYPDMTKLELTPEYYGMPIPITANYDPEIGELKINWENPDYPNLKPEDETYIMALYFKPAPVILWTKHTNPWKTLKIWGNAEMPVTYRKNKIASILIDKYLDHSFLYAYLIFKSNNSHYSKSYCIPLNPKN